MLPLGGLITSVVLPYIELCSCVKTLLPLTSKINVLQRRLATQTAEQLSSDHNSLPVWYYAAPVGVGGWNVVKETFFFGFLSNLTRVLFNFRCAHAKTSASKVRLPA